MCMNSAGTLGGLYLKYNNRRHVYPDPLQFLYDYPRIRDREIAGLIAACLAYGRVTQIVKSVSEVLCTMGPSPYHYLLKTGKGGLLDTFSHFRHRFTDGHQLVFLLCCMQNTIKKYGSLQACFLTGYGKADENLLPSVKNFIRRLTCKPQNFCNSLLPLAGGKSAYKRFNLFLRWMVRKDKVDPGGWKGIQTSQLIIPLDTHMHKIAQKLGFTARKQADIITALEITRAFKRICPSDPVKFDFALTRAGMKNSGHLI